MILEVDLKRDKKKKEEGRAREEVKNTRERNKYTESAEE